MIELKYESIWFDQRSFEEAESRYQTFLVQKSDQSGEAKVVSLVLLFISILDLRSFYYQVLYVLESRGHAVKNFIQLQISVQKMSLKSFCLVWTRQQFSNKLNV